MQGGSRCLIDSSRWGGDVCKLFGQFSNSQGFLTLASDFLPFGFWLLAFNAREAMGIPSHVNEARRGRC